MRRTEMTWTRVVMIAATFVVSACASTMSPAEPTPRLDAGVFDAWDGDLDGWLDRDELTTGFERDGIFDRYDWDHDGRLGMAEVGVFDDEIGPDQEIGFDAADLDDDGFLDGRELAYGAFDAWDGDDSGLLGRDELGVYR